MINNSNFRVKTTGFKASFEHDYIPTRAVLRSPSSDSDSCIDSCSDTDSYSFSVSIKATLYTKEATLYTKPTRNELKLIEQRINVENAKRESGRRRHVRS